MGSIQPNPTHVGWVEFFLPTMVGWVKKSPQLDLCTPLVNSSLWIMICSLCSYIQEKLGLNRNKKLTEMKLIASN